MVPKSPRMWCCCEAKRSARHFELGVFSLSSFVIDQNSLQMLCQDCHYEFCFDCAEEVIIFLVLFVVTSQFHGTKSCDDFKTWKMKNNKLDLRFGSSFSPFWSSQYPRLWLWEKMNAKPCPNCKAKIEKRSGCNHMTCAKYVCESSKQFSCFSCRHEWCWQCSKPYTVLFSPSWLYVN